MFETNILLNFKDLFYLGAIMLSFYLFYLERKSSAKERSELLDRIMAKDYEQFEYFQKQFEGEVKELKEQRDAVRKKSGVDEEIKEEMDLEYKKEKEFIEKTDEDWNENEVDVPELRKRLNKE